MHSFLFLTPQWAHLLLHTHIHTHTHTHIYIYIYIMQGKRDLPNFVRVVKSRRMRWAGHVARIGEGGRCAQGSGGEI